MSTFVGSLRAVVRLVSVPVTVFLIATFSTYALGALGGANPAATVLGQDATASSIAQLNHEFGLDKPFLVDRKSVV